MVASNAYAKNGESRRTLKAGGFAKDDSGRDGD